MRGRGGLSARSSTARCGRGGAASRAAQGCGQERQGRRRHRPRRRGGGAGRGRRGPIRFLHHAAEIRSRGAGKGARHPRHAGGADRPAGHLFSAGRLLPRRQRRRARARPARTSRHRRHGAARCGRRRCLAQGAHRSDPGSGAAEPAAPAAAGQRPGFPGNTRRRMRPGAAYSSAPCPISMPSDRSLRYRCVRSMSTRLASSPTLPLHSISCCCR